MGPLPEIRHEGDHDERPEVVAARDEARSDAGDVEAAFESGGDHVDEAVDGHPLNETEYAHEDEETSGPVATLSKIKPFQFIVDVSFGRASIYIILHCTVILYYTLLHMISGRQINLICHSLPKCIVNE